MIEVRLLWRGRSAICFFIFRATAGGQTAYGCHDNTTDQQQQGSYSHAVRKDKHSDGFGIEELKEPDIFVLVECTFAPAFFQP
jgi:hypothetical protein